MKLSTAKAFRRLFFEMKAIWLDGPTPFPVPFATGERALAPGERDNFNESSVKPVAWGCTARTLRSGEAAIRLAAAGLSEEASPLLRSAIEHSMFLWWLQAERGKVIEVLKRSQKESMQKLLKAQSIGWAFDASTPAIIQQRMDDATEQHKTLDFLSRTANLARQYPADLGTLFQAWLYDTQTAHATLQSASAYYRLIPAGQPNGPGFKLLQDPEHVGNVEARAAVAAHVALTGYSRASGLEDYFQPRLDTFSGRFSMLMASDTS
ncbi:DUF5677 domain-containing protein [Arthrobacter bambusae]|uniref:DUF5677 domain-containing protein n=1 Tax=Arthrobacter bambusae TaxID=1338426 RepID=UPI0027839309|nr:DUF5677 domain-containing protein [Arthrobacter bambusae]MDQ0212567.1 hypothetical protein [Arthrobacter bambusae]MDQ0236949.1 hypothetical protein [Arthrobacter bambusae]